MFQSMFKLLSHSPTCSSSRRILSSRIDRYFNLFMLFSGISYNSRHNPECCKRFTVNLRFEVGLLFTAKCWGVKVLFRGTVYKCTSEDTSRWIT